MLTDGGASLSMMLSTPAARASVPVLGLLRVRLTVSTFSSRASSAIGTVKLMVWLSLPVPGAAAALSGKLSVPELLV